MASSALHGDVPVNTFMQERIGFAQLNISIN